MLSHHHVAWSEIEADRAFTRAARSRRRASLSRLLLRRCVECAQLIVHDPRALTRQAARAGVREIPLDAITGTLEPGRALEFDSEFRPSPRTRKRWLRVWVAEHEGPGLPPISVVQVGADAYAIADGHHRVSVARARGAATIDAIVA
jgi:hypothetical protein